MQDMVLLRQVGLFSLHPSCTLFSFFFLSHFLYPSIFHFFSYVVSFLVLFSSVYLPLSLFPPNPFFLFLCFYFLYHSAFSPSICPSFHHYPSVIPIITVFVYLCTYFPFIPLLLLCIFFFCLAILPPLAPPGLFFHPLLFSLYPESGHLVDHQSDPESVHGGLSALLAPEKTQQENDSQSPEEKNCGGERASPGRAGPIGSRHEYIPGRCTRS